ncbi:MAG: LamG domain-containing protein, partial [Planctomycetes bacterium]|nr:LamG domain-containing protein [Planctomycetota bacterium]
MSTSITTAILCALTACPVATVAEEGGWWNPEWHCRTTVARSTPWRDDAPRPVGVAIDFPLLLQRGDIAGQFDPGSLRVVERADDGYGREVPFACRAEFGARADGQQSYLTWIARPRNGEVGAYDVYFGTRDQHLKARKYETNLLPPENLLANHGFEDEADGLPDGWTVTPKELVRLGRFAHTTGRQSLAVVVDEKTREDAGREVTVSQRIDVSKFAGQEVVFECDLLAERAAYGAPVSIELEQFRADGSRILEYAVEPRWLTIELAEGQLVQFSERGRLNPEAAGVNVKVRMRCTVRDADTRRSVTGPESFFTIWLDRFVFRPGERWSWPAATGAGFVEGALEEAPLNRGFQFTGQRRLAFNGASEGTLTAGKYNPDARSVHWGLEAGTLEFWCRPMEDAEDLGERVFFDSVAYGHRLQSRLRRTLIDGKSHLEFTVADAGPRLRSVRGPARLEAGRSHHIAATWDFPKAHLQLLVDGKLIAAEGPHDRPWPSTRSPEDKEKGPGIGIMETDRRSMPMQAFIGGDTQCSEDRGAEAVLDEFRISDVVRYSGDFVPSRREFSVDRHTRALFHFENERHGEHHSDDRFVRGHLACELPRQKEKAPLETFQGGKIQRRMVLVKPHASDELFEKNRVENRLVVTRPLRELPDPRFVEYRPRQHQRTVTAEEKGFLLEVGGDYEPVMRSVTFERTEGSSRKTTLLPRWRANDNVAPFSAASLAATLAADVTDDEEKAFEVIRYALATSNYYDAHFSETLPTRHRSRV